MEGGPVLHAVACAGDRDDLGMVEEAVEQGAGQDVIAQQRAPLGEAGVAGEQNGSFLIAGRDEFEEGMSLLGQ